MLIKSLMRSTKILIIMALSMASFAQIDVCFAQVHPYLSLDDYLYQVNHHHCGIQGGRKIVRGSQQRVVEANLITRPSLFAEAQYIRNVYNPTFSPIEGNQSEIETGKLGFSEVTPFGLQGKLYYNYQYQNYSGTNPLFVNNTNFYSSSPVLEFNLSLWRNFAGRETRATQCLIASQVKFIHYSEQFKITSLLAQAETTYWRLAVAQHVVNIQLASLDRAKRIRAWASKRTRLRLADRADWLQAEAGVDSRRLDLQTSIDELKLAAHAFNTMRGMPCDYVPEQLIDFNAALFDQLPTPCFHPIRDDVKAAEQQKNIAVANARLGIEKNKPDLDLYATYSFNGRNPDMNQAVSESFSTTYPSTVVGIRLKMPLDYGSLHRVKTGYRNQIYGAEEQYHQQVYESHQLWNELIIRLQTAKKRLCLARQLEDIQLEKLNSEKQRHSAGRTTTYQVLLFEQDYANSQISRLMIQAEILGYLAQLKTFGACV